MQSASQNPDGSHSSRLKALAGQTSYPSDASDRDEVSGAPDTFVSTASQIQSGMSAQPPFVSTFITDQEHDMLSQHVMAVSEPAAALRISVDDTPSTPTSKTGHEVSASLIQHPVATLEHKLSSSNLKPVSRTPSLKAALAHSMGARSMSGSSSLVPSPIITAMGDVTPLPSPLMSGDSPGPWRLLSSGSPPQSQRHIRMHSVGEGSVLVTKSGESIDAALYNAPKRKLYASIDAGKQGIAIPIAADGHHLAAPHSRNRSISDYVPDSSAVVPKRQIAVSGSQLKIDVSDAQDSHLRREQNLAESRGLTPTVTKPPTPPPSVSSRDSGEGNSGRRRMSGEYFEAYGRHDETRRRWRSVRLLGEGTFSRVMLATSQMDIEDAAGSDSDTLLASSTEQQMDRKTLVAVKVCEHGPRGGASEERIEMSLKRELEILKSIHHPCLVDLKAWSIEPTRAILVLSYCPGGDLFDVATAHREALTPTLLRRIFAEVVCAVQYLHERRIVHRDIKLENVLVNLSPSELIESSIDWTTYPYSVVTLTDMGLSRRVADDEKLETRCGSEDYAAPEVIMGQPYDGRATDAWSLGVLLYALLEARLPFDPHPGMSEAHRMRSRTSHRIARVEWCWVEYAGNDTDHDGDEAKFKAKNLLGAMEITEDLLKRARSRCTVAKVAANPWVSGGMSIEGGLRFREERAGEEVP